MESNNNMIYDVSKSARRMNDILESDRSNFTNKNKVPSSKSLTYKNGYYVDVTALFIDIVSSSDMTDKHKRPALAKMYRCFISECVAIMNSESICKEVSVNGDCVWAVFDTPKKKDINTVIGVAFKLNSMIKILNYKLVKKKYSPIKVGIGIDYGRALMVKAGFPKSGINDVIWMGDVVNSACHIGNKAGRKRRKTIVISKVIFDRVYKQDQHSFTYFTKNNITYYETDMGDAIMDGWYKKHCK